jgi:hypothetical protein
MLREQPTIHLTITCITLNCPNFVQMAGNTRLVPRSLIECGQGVTDQFPPSNNPVDVLLSPTKTSESMSIPFEAVANKLVAGARKWLGHVRTGTLYIDPGSRW